MLDFWDYVNSALLFGGGGYMGYEYWKYRRDLAKAKREKKKLEKAPQRDIPPFIPDKLLPKGQ